MSIINSNMNELYEKPLHTEGNFWAGHDRNSILRVRRHATISAVQISRDHNQTEDRVAGI
jgi:hypothetical protein